MAANLEPLRQRSGAALPATDSQKQTSHREGAGDEEREGYFVTGLKSYAVLIILLLVGYFGLQFYQQRQ